MLGVLALTRGIITTSRTIELKQIDLKTKQLEVNTLQEKLKNYEQKLEGAKGDSEKLEKLEKERLELERENQRLQQELVSKRLKQAEEKKVAVVHAGNYMSQCQEWMRQAGVPITSAALKLIQHESGCNPHAVNPSSGACGIGQQLPCGKWAHQWNDPVGGLKDMYQYVVNRYGSWEAAWHFWQFEAPNYNGSNWY